MRRVMLKAERLQAIADATNKEKIVTSEDTDASAEYIQGNRQKWI